MRCIAVYKEKLKMYAHQESIAYKKLSLEIVKSTNLRIAWSI